MNFSDEPKTVWPIYSSSATESECSSPRRRFDKVLDFARVCRVESVMRPYLEAVSVSALKNVGASLPLYATQRNSNRESGVCK